MKQKIFQIGFNKCGTVSLWILFKHNAKPLISSVHWDDCKLALSIQKNLEQNKPLLSDYEDFTFFSDMEAVFYDNGYPVIIEGYKYYNILDTQYPNSKFILNTRDIDKWIISRTIFQTYLSVLKDDHIVHKQEDYDYILYYMDKYDTTSIQDIASIWRNDYYRHIHNVRKYFSNRPHDLLEYNIDTDSIDKIKEFFKDDGIVFTTDSLPVLNRSCDQKWFKGNA